MLKVLMVYRKRNPKFFSIEAVFDRVKLGWGESRLPGVFELPEYGVSVRNLLFLLRQRRNHPDAIFHVTGDAHYVVAVLPRKRTILTIHDCIFLERHGGLKRWILKMTMLTIPVWLTKYITTISEKTKEEIVRYTGCNPGRIRVISNPVSPLLVYREKEFNSQRPVLLFIGVTPNKNLERVSEALQGIPCLLRVIGKLGEEQVNLLKKFSISFEMAYGLSEPEMAEEYSRADIVMYPSLYEGFGLPIIEGFKAGRMVLTSDLPPMNHVADDAACLVDPYDAASIRSGLLHIISDAEYREWKISRGFDLVKQYDPAFVAEQYKACYRQIESDLNV